MACADADADDRLEPKLCECVRGKDGRGDYTLRMSPARERAK